MAALFALGVMSITWMALVAGIIAMEKTLPWRRVAVYGMAAVLLVLGVLILISPHAVPWLTLPASDQPMPMMTPDTP
jgi:predicted metal-binding membrane protein